MIINFYIPYIDIIIIILYILFDDEYIIRARLPTQRRSITTANDAKFYGLPLM